MIPPISNRAPRSETGTDTLEQYLGAAGHAAVARKASERSYSSAKTPGGIPGAGLRPALPGHKPLIVNEL
jgi:hypothetical protein